MQQMVQKVVQLLRALVSHGLDVLGNISHQKASAHFILWRKSRKGLMFGYFFNFLFDFENVAFIMGLNENVCSPTSINHYLILPAA
jgi:hypothetical protein